MWSIHIWASLECLDAIVGLVAKYRHEGFSSGYVVLRIDDYDVSGVPKEQLISTKELWWSEAKARAEVERLNAVAKPSARYFALHVYVEPRLPDGAP
jgi:hypothetical protein